MEIKVKPAQSVAILEDSMSYEVDEPFSFLHELGSTNVSPAIHSSRKVFNLFDWLSCKRDIAVVLAKRIYENIVRRESAE